jgi:hypothetical protein
MRHSISSSNKLAQFSHMLHRIGPKHFGLMNQQLEDMIASAERHKFKKET